MKPLKALFHRLHMPQRNKSLTWPDMLSEAYCNVPIGDLLKQYTLPMRTDLLGSYVNYTPSQLKTHYDLEVRLADKLRASSKEERFKLYAEVYNELFQRLPYHPQLQRKTEPEERLRAVRRTANQLRRFLSKDDVFLELGPGDCLLSFEMTKYVKKVFAVDVSEEITKNSQLPENFELILSDGSSVDVPEGSVKLAYSNQLMEHLHPEDAAEQLDQIYKALGSGGMYYFVTPHKFFGPTDVSRFFDKEARGLHLKEYTLSEIDALLKKTGFSRIFLPRRMAGKYVNLPVSAGMAVERMIHNLPYKRRKEVYKRLQKLLVIRVIARKD